MNQTERPQLRMVWPTHRINQPPDVTPPHGYSIRPFRSGDEERFHEVMDLAGWPGWNTERLQFSLSRILPSGWFMATREDTGHIVASVMCIHSASEVQGLQARGISVGEPRAFLGRFAPARCGQVLTHPTAQASTCLERAAHASTCLCCRPTKKRFKYFSATD
jgi:hypothetical protein